MAGGKVLQYGLDQRAIELQARGLGTIKIAEKLTAELMARGVNDTISQSTVSRFFRALRRERKKALRKVAEEQLDATFPSDLQVLEEIKWWFVKKFRDKSLELRTRATMAQYAIKVIEAKVRLAGLSDDSKDRPVRLDPVDLEKYLAKVQVARAEPGEAQQEADERRSVH